MIEFILGGITAFGIFLLIYFATKSDNRISEPVEVENTTVGEPQPDISEPVKSIIKAMEERPRTFKVYPSDGPPNSHTRFMDVGLKYNGVSVRLSDTCNRVLVKDIVTGFEAHGCNAEYLISDGPKPYHTTPLIGRRVLVDAPFTLTWDEISELAKAFRKLDEYRQVIKNQIKAKRKQRQVEASNKIREQWVEVYSTQASQEASEAVNKTT